MGAYRKTFMIRILEFELNCFKLSIANIQNSVQGICMPTIPQLLIDGVLSTACSNVDQSYKDGQFY